jgi:hypothetical protein
MVRVQIIGLALASVVLIACGPKPLKVLAGDQCYGCRRSIRNERLASETIGGEGAQFVSKFRGPGCMARYLVAHPDEKPTIYVTDYTSGKMFRAAGAYFVAETVDNRTGETEYRSYRTRDEAERAAVELRTTPLSWDEVLENAR